MSYYSPAISANNNYWLLPHFFNKGHTDKEIGVKVRREESRKTLVFEGRSFEVVDFNTFLEDVKNTRFNKFLAEAIQYMQEHVEHELVDQALPILRVLNEKTTVYESFDLPQLSASIPDDKELLVEWNFEHFGVGLSFEMNPEESSWYIVNDGTVNKMTGWGYLNSQTNTELVNIILSQAVENAT